MLKMELFLRRTTFQHVQHYVSFLKCFPFHAYNDHPLDLVRSDNQLNLKWLLPNCLKDVTKNGASCAGTPPLSWLMKCIQVFRIVYRRWKLCLMVRSRRLDAARSGQRIICKLSLRFTYLPTFTTFNKKVMIEDGWRRRSHADPDIGVRTPQNLFNELCR